MTSQVDDKVTDEGTTNIVTYLFIKRLNDAVASALRRLALGKKKARTIYATYPLEVRRVWTDLLTDPVARKHVRLAATWSVTTYQNEGRSTLLELLLHFCTFANRANGRNKLCFNDTCFADLLENLRTHPYHERIHNTRSWAVSWNEKTSHWIEFDSHDLGSVCQSILYNNNNSSSNNNPFIEHSSEFMMFVLEVLDHALDKSIVARTQLHVYSLYCAIAHSQGGAWMARLIGYARKYLLFDMRFTDSFAYVMMSRAPLHTLDEWMQSDVDYCLHSDWYHFMCSLDLSNWSTPSTHASRLAHMTTLQQRWHASVINMLHAYVLSDVVQHVILPYLEPVLT
jgi:hypothetical protein